MAQYDVHRNTDEESARNFPFIVDVQADLLRHLDTRLVVPLGRLEAGFKSLGRLTPPVEIEGESLLFLVNHAVSMQRSILGPIVGSAAGTSVDLLNAIDFLLTGA
jgi:toxin CcdB